MRTKRRRTESVVGRRLAGAVFVLIPVLLVTLSWAVYDKRFTKVSWVTVETASTGSGLHKYADVKLRGVVVGQVRRIHTTGGGATLKLAIRPGMMDRLPRNVTAQMMPTTLFGQRYVALIPPPNPSVERLTAGSVITRDRSTSAIELQQLLDSMMPLLTAVQPAKLATTLTAISQALDGRGTQLGQTMVQLDAYLKKLNPSMPAFNRGILELVRVSRTYDQAAPEILQALNDLTITSRTLVERQSQLSTAYAAVTSSAEDLTDFLRENSGNIIRLSAHSRPSLEVFAKHSPAFPCTLRMLTDFIPKMDEVLGKGTRHPGLHVVVETVADPGSYRPGKDRPVYRSKGGPRCYPAPYGSGGKAPKASRQGLGLPNSPEENQLVNELLAPGLQDVPEGLPDWSSVLVGPLFRGTQVTVR